MRPTLRMRTRFLSQNTRSSKSATSAAGGGRRGRRAARQVLHPAITSFFYDRDVGGRSTGPWWRLHAAKYQGKTHDAIRMISLLFVWMTFYIPYNRTLIRRPHGGILSRAAKHTELLLPQSAWLDKAARKHDRILVVPCFCVSCTTQQHSELPLDPWMRWAMLKNVLVRSFLGGSDWLWLGWGFFYFLFLFFFPYVSGLFFFFSSQQPLFVLCTICVCEATLPLAVVPLSRGYFSTSATCPSPAISAVWYDV